MIVVRQSDRATLGTLLPRRTVLPLGPHSNVNNTNLISNSLARPPNRLIYLFSLAYKYPLDFLGCQKIKASKEGCEKLFDDEKIYLLLACCCRVATLTFTIPEEDTDTSQQRKLFFNPIN